MYNYVEAADDDTRWSNLLDMPDEPNGKENEPHNPNPQPDQRYNSFLMYTTQSNYALNYDQ